MPGYVEKALRALKHVCRRPQHAPTKCNTSRYEKEAQVTEKPDTSPPVPPEDILHLQQAVGRFLLYYAWAIDMTMFHELNFLAIQKGTASEKTMNDLTWFLNYCATHPNAILSFHASDMILYIHSGP